MLHFFRASTSVSAIMMTTIIANSGCRSGLRPQASAGDPVSIEMRLVGLKDSDRERSELIYTLSGCGAGSTNGKKSSENLVKFETQNVRKDDRCDLRIQTTKNDTGVANWFAEDGLMYEARRIAITSNEGRLQGVAMVQQLYATPPTITGTPPASIWKLSTSIKAPKALPELCTCSISCQPSLTNNVAKLDLTSDKAIGTCEFANIIRAGLQKIECSKMMVQCGAEFFVGTWPAGTVVDGSQPNNANLPTLMMQAGVPEETSDTTIEVVVPH
jgi:hypothetical protein